MITEIKPLIRKIKNYIKNSAYKIKSTFIISEQEKWERLWQRDNKDNRLRLDYDMDESSVVFDIGGYKGQWANDIYSKYNCKIYVFEPILEYSDNIQKRFQKNRNIFVFPFGLAGQSSESIFSKCQNKSSVYPIDNSPKETVLLKRISDFISENSISHIDLMKINIEGGEYGLLEDLIGSGNITIIDNIQVQFHNNIPNAIIRLKKIQEQLKKTHDITYQYPFIWENWRKRDNAK
jgi:FkbM family methyltransferase